ncbi:hypothetical protein INR49_026657 [Caranx melampygus]|nr:hypothetical protein INR49_026657 [Caranx melampygus]
MKTFTLAVVVAIMLICICLQESSATSTKTPEPKDPVTTDSPDVDSQVTSVNSWMMLYNRHKRGFSCHFCCGCCNPAVCGLCCKF